MALRIVHPTDGWGQHKTRGILILFDQHRAPSHPEGRPWWCYTERQVDPGAAPQPVGELQPIVADLRGDDGEVIHGWTAPWIPEPKYIMLSANFRTGNRFRIRYDAMIADYREGMEAYYRRAVQEAAALNLRLPTYGAAVEYRLRMIVGEPPKNPKIPEAALAGDRWLLGFDPRANEALQRLLYTGQAAIPTAEESAAMGAALDESFSAEEIAAAVKALRGVKQAATMRSAKAAKRPSSSPAPTPERA